MPSIWAQPSRSAIQFFVALAFALAATDYATAGSASVALDTRRIATGFSRPVYATAPPGDTERLFVVEQRGLIRILDLATGTINPTPFLNIDSIVGGGTFGQDERGLLGLAFHPDYDTNGWFFVYFFTNGSATEVRRFTVSADPDVADAGSGTTVLTIGQPFSNHNGGTIAFSPIDGYLYIGTGDGGSAGDPGNNAQNLNSRLGKMLRIDVDSLPFTVPADNPLVGIAGDDLIWSHGLRNPYRWAFDRLTGDLVIGDVGQNAFEELNFEPAGTPNRDYGWKCQEGDACFSPAAGCTCNSAALTDPVHTYPQSTGVSIIGGPVYRGCEIPEIEGTLFFGDFATSRLWSAEINATQDDLIEFVDRTAQLTPPPGQGSIGNPSCIVEDGNGELYILTFFSGAVYKVVPANLADLDCDGNFVVDSCEAPQTDCDNDGTSDSCEIALGEATDCNQNGIPDDCDLDAGLLVDCDSNGVADLCEIQDGVALDCNSNDIPDSCDIDSGLAEDNNGDGFIDSCDLYIVRVSDEVGPAGGQVQVEVLFTSPETFGGYSMSYTYDPTKVEATSTELTGTDADGSDFFAPSIDPVAGYVKVGVVADISPPIEVEFAPATDFVGLRVSMGIDASNSVGEVIDLLVDDGNTVPDGAPIISIEGGTQGVSPLTADGSITVIDAPIFVRGEVNQDGSFNIADPVFTLNFLFVPNSPEPACEDSADANDDGSLNVADPVYMLNLQFVNGPAIPAPTPNCGADPTDDSLDCASFTACP